MPCLENKTAIITGAAGGIGAEAARRFVAEGASVLLVDRDKAALRKLAGDLACERVGFFVADVTEETSAQSFVEEAGQRFGKIDIALLNAGIEGKLGRIEDLPVEVFDQVMAVNVRSVWLGLAALMPAMRKSGGGSIVITSSAAGLRGSPKLAAYSASKHAVIGLMKSAAIDGAPHGIRINAINPGQTRTRMMEAIDMHMATEGRPGDPAASIPMGRYANPSEVVALMLFLASDESTFCTGATYLVDGGYTS